MSVLDELPYAIITIIMLAASLALSDPGSAGAEGRAGPPLFLAILPVTEFPTWPPSSGASRLARSRPALSPPRELLSP
jgi:hypothetical protein